MKEKLSYCQVISVVSELRRRGKIVDRQRMMQVPPEKEPKEFQYRLLADGIELPKKRYGEKFFVQYTVLQEKQF